MLTNSKGRTGRMGNSTCCVKVQTCSGHFEDKQESGPCIRRIAKISRRVTPVPVLNVGKTGMHSRRMRTIHCSGRLQGGGLPGGRGVCQGGCLPDACENITFPQLLLRTETRCSTQ